MGIARPTLHGQDQSEIIWLAAWHIILCPNFHAQMISDYAQIIEIFLEFQLTVQTRAARKW